MGAAASCHGCKRQVHSGEGTQQDLHGVIQSREHAECSGQDTVFSDFWSHKGCVLPHVEQRAISVSQLLLVRTHITRRCKAEKWVCHYPSPHELTLESVNMYNICQYVIKPATEILKCSFVELLASSPQLPSWFCNHWWGDSVLKLIKCVECHMVLRELSRDNSFYWICAFAINQHQLELEITHDPTESSFVRAMHQSVGVLLTLDKSATAFARIWCSFDLAMMVKSRDELLFDIATVADGKAEILTTDGLTVEEARKEAEEYPGRGWELKSEREQRFPLAICEPGLHVSIQHADATVDLDKRAILNTLTMNRDLESQPPNDHHLYDVVNRRLRGIFAVSTWRQAIAKGVDNSDESALPLSKTLHEDTDRRALTLYLANVQELTDHDVINIARGMPLKLTSVHLDFRSCGQLTSVDELANGLAQLQHLTTVHLDFACCGHIKSIDELAKGLSQLRYLTSVHLDFAYCGRITSLDELAKRLALLQHLTSVYLDFAYCSQLTSLDELVKGIAQLQQLTSLHLDFAYCGQITSLDELAKGLAQLQRLTSLHLDFRCCGRITSIDELAKSFEQLLGLTSVHFDFRACHQITSIDEFAKGLALLKDLTSLRLDFSACGQITSLDALAEGLKNLQHLRDLRLDLSAGGQITSLDELTKSLAQRQLFTHGQETDMKQKEEQEKMEQGYDFWFVDAGRIKQSIGPLRKHQELRESPGWLKCQRIGIHEIINFVLCNCLVVSYVWLQPGHPDPDGEQADALRAWLSINPHISFVWIDWCSLPQGQRSPDEQREFSLSLALVNMVYLSCRVLKITNSQYIARFWPQFEAWLSFQKLRPDGSGFITDTTRSNTTFTGFARDDDTEAEFMERAVRKRWSTATLDQVIERLGRDEVAITNKGDKAKQFRKIRDLLQAIKTVYSKIS